jgi:lipoate-protein ligase A
MKQETGLVLAGNSKLGRALIIEANKANNEKMQKRVVATVQELMAQIERQKQQIKIHQSAVKIMERRVIAIKAGKFTVNELGTITFTEAELGKDQAFVTTCGQCGYSKTVIAKI